MLLSEKICENCVLQMMVSSLHLTRPLFALESQRREERMGQNLVAEKDDDDDIKTTGMDAINFLTRRIYFAAIKL